MPPPLSSMRHWGRKESKDEQDRYIRPSGIFHHTLVFSCGHRSGLSNMGKVMPNLQTLLNAYLIAIAAGLCTIVEADGVLLLIGLATVVAIAAERVGRGG